MQELRYAVANYFTVSELIDFESKRLPKNYMDCFSPSQIKIFHNQVEINKTTTSKMMNNIIVSCLNKWQETNGSSLT